jgi:hypothetical protein
MYSIFGWEETGVSTFCFVTFGRTKMRPTVFPGLRVKGPGGKTKKESVRNSIKDKQ